jgi:hypothetical protein
MIHVHAAAAASTRSAAFHANGEAVALEATRAAQQGGGRRFRTEGRARSERPRLRQSARGAEEVGDADKKNRQFLAKLAGNWYRFS